MCSWWPEQSFGLETKVWYHLWHSRGSMLCHEESGTRIIHRDIKASNILLDQKLKPKIRLWACSSSLRWQNSSHDRNSWDSVSILYYYQPAACLSFCYVSSVIQRPFWEAIAQDLTNWDGSMCSGYMAPEYVVHGHLIEKTDVHSFGVLVIEIVAGKRCCGSTGSHFGHSLLAEVWTTSYYLKSET